MSNRFQKCLRQDITPSTRKTELARIRKKCFPINWGNLKKIWSLWIWIWKQKCQQWEPQRLGPILRRTFINHLDQGLSTLAPQQSHPYCFKKKLAMLSPPHFHSLRMGPRPLQLLKALFWCTVKVEKHSRKFQWDCIFRGRKMSS